MKNMIFTLPSLAFGIDIQNYGDESELIYMLDVEDLDPTNKTDEVLIAEFMGRRIKNYPIQYSDRVGDYFEEDDDFEINLTYDKYWDSLMPVVEKISTIMPHIEIPRDLEALKNGTHGSEEHVEVLSLSISSPIGDIYSAVIKFIKWYSQQPKP